MRLWCIIYMLASFFVSSYSIGGQSSLREPNPDALIKKSSDVLLSLTDVEYNYSREVSYPSMDIFDQSTKAICYFDFRNKNSLHDLAYIIKADTITYINKDQKSMVIVNKKRPLGRTSMLEINNVPYFCNSILTLRNFLPKLSAKKEIKKVTVDTMINNVGYHVIKFSLQNQTLDNLGDIVNIVGPVKINYSILIRKNDAMPVQIIQSNGNQGYIKTYFSNIILSPGQPKFISWDMKY